MQNYYGIAWCDTAGDMTESKSKKPKTKKPKSKKPKTKKSNIQKSWCKLCFEKGKSQCIIHSKE